MVLEYACVADASGIIVSESQNPLIDEVVSVLLTKVDFYVDHKKSFAGHPKTKGCTIQYVVDNELCFVSAASSDFPQRICFAFLEKLRSEYFSQFHGKGNTPALKAFIVEQMDFFSNNPAADKLSGLKVKVNEITNVMHENVEKLLVRGDVIEGIEGRTEDLRVKTSEFDKQAKRVRCAMCVEHCKAITCLVIVIVIILIIIIVVIAVLIYVIFFSGAVM